jgi:transposase
MFMFLDRASWHNAKALEIPENVALGFLPPYSPELNPQEQVWDELREKFFCNRAFKSLDAVIDNAVKGLQFLESFPAKIKSLTLRSWMLNPC